MCWVVNYRSVWTVVAVIMVTHGLSIGFGTTASDFGFGGGISRAIGEVYLYLSIDDMGFDLSALVSDVELGEIDLLLMERPPSIVLEF